MNSRLRADLYQATGFSSPAMARAYFAAVNESAGRPRRRRKYRAWTTVGILVVGLLLVVLL